MKKSIKILLIVLAVIIVIAASGTIAFAKVNNSLKSLTDISVKDFDFTAISDGVYNGNYKCFPVDVEVAVTVLDGKITDIDLIKHFNGKGGAAEVLPGIVVDKQTLEVDTISGATFSSKVILLAIQDALEKASA
jgi:uncharacterized protein with FMN-binding domain